MDIRKIPNENIVQFADKVGGGHRCYKLEKNLPVQFDITTVDGTSLHIKHEDIDNLIKALKYVKDHWG